MHCQNSKTRKNQPAKAVTTMKETVNVNIGSMAFTLDKDACRLLSSYFDDIRRRLPEDDAETMADIEPVFISPAFNMPVVIKSATILPNLLS